MVFRNRGHAIHVTMFVPGGCTFLFRFLCTATTQKHNQELDRAVLRLNERFETMTKDLASLKSTSMTSFFQSTQQILDLNLGWERREDLGDQLGDFVSLTCSNSSASRRHAFLDCFMDLNRELVRSCWSARMVNFGRTEKGRFWKGELRAC